MKIAVAGAGLAGLSATWHLLQKGFSVVLFDPLGIGGGASGVSTGLLHPFPGKQAAKSWRADEGMDATCASLEIAEEVLGLPVADRNGIFRPAITETQKQDFFKNQNAQALWTEMELPGMPKTWGLWVEEGITVFSRRYLQGLWKACEKMGAIFFQDPLPPPDVFDVIVLAAGSEIVKFPDCQDLKFRTAIGQSLLCEWKTPLAFSLASQGYITVTEDPHLCQVGSTYEHTLEPDPKKALELIDKVSSFYPPAKDFKVLEIRSGVRIAPKEGHQPILERINSKTWVFTGLGSRGMLYHALLAQDLAEKISAEFR